MLEHVGETYSYIRKDILLINVSPISFSLERGESTSPLPPPRPPPRAKGWQHALQGCPKGNMHATLVKGGGPPNGEYPNIRMCSSHGYVAGAKIYIFTYESLSNFKVPKRSQDSRSESDRAAFGHQCGPRTPDRSPIRPHWGSHLR